MAIKPPIRTKGRSRSVQPALAWHRRWASADAKRQQDFALETMGGRLVTARMKKSLQKLASAVTIGESGGVTYVDASRLPGLGAGLTLPPPAHSWLSGASLGFTPIDDIPSVGTEFEELEVLEDLLGSDAATLNQAVSPDMPDEKLLGPPGLDRRHSIDWSLALQWKPTRWLAGVAEGSGFLVGDRFLLTNAHVVKDKYGNLRKNLKARFGHFAWGLHNEPKYSGPLPPIPVEPMFPYPMLSTTMHPPIDVIDVICPPGGPDGGRKTLKKRTHDIAVCVLERPPTMYESILYMAEFGLPPEIPGWWLSPNSGDAAVELPWVPKYKLAKYVAELDVEEAWGFFPQLASHTPAFNGKGGAVVAGLRWMPRLPKTVLDSLQGDVQRSLSEPSQSWMIGKTLGVELQHEAACLVRHTMDTSGGMSGGPLFRTVGGTLTATGVHVAAGKGNYNLAVSGTEMVVCVLSAMAKHPT